jgi:hypothetical protein
MSLIGMGQITDAQSAANCAAGGGTYDIVSGDCNAPPGGALYTAQLPALIAADCPWYCMPFLTYPAESACSVCVGTGITASPGGIPLWGWAAAALAALYMITSAVGRK